MWRWVRKNEGSSRSNYWSISPWAMIRGIFNPVCVCVFIQNGCMYCVCVYSYETGARIYLYTAFAHNAKSLWCASVCDTPKLRVAREGCGRLVRRAEKLGQNHWNRTNLPHPSLTSYILYHKIRQNNWNRTNLPHPSLTPYILYHKIRQNNWNRTNLPHPSGVTRSLGVSECVLVSQDLQDLHNRLIYVERDLQKGLIN